jgi:hypothetical protein
VNVALKGFLDGSVGYAFIMGLKAVDLLGVLGATSRFVAEIGVNHSVTEVLKIIGLHLSERRVVVGFVI